MLTGAEVRALKKWAQGTDDDRAKIRDLEHRLRLRTRMLVEDDSVCQELKGQIEHLTEGVNESFTLLMREAEDSW